MGRVRWGILGAAKIAREWVVPAIHMSDRGESRRSPAARRARARSWRDHTASVTLHASYEALLADPQVDAIYIPLPNGEHVEWTAKCLEAGKHVLCEKPIALRAEEIDGLIALRDRTGLVAAEAFMVASPAVDARARAGRGGGDRPAPAGAGCVQLLQRRSRQHPQPRGAGGGALRDIGVYPCVSTRFVTGAEPQAVPYAAIDWDPASMRRRGCRGLPGFGWSSTSRCGWRRGS